MRSILFALSMPVTLWSQSPRHSLSPYTIPRYEVGPIANPGTIRGRLTFEGDPPTMSSVPISADPVVCGTGRKPNQTLILGPDGGIKNGVIVVRDIDRGKAPDLSVTPMLDQIECVYVPHVMTAFPAQDILIRNSDATMHNVHAFTQRGMYTPFNVGLPTEGIELVQKMPGKPGALVIKCDAGHRWMRAYIWVVPSPYFAITASDGTFEIEGLPRGWHRVTLWHELFRSRDVNLLVPPEGDLEIEVQGLLKPKRQLVLN